MSHLTMTEEQFRAHVARNAAKRAERGQGASVGNDQPKTVPALLAAPQTYGGGAIEFLVAGQPIPKGRPRLGRHGTYTPKRTASAEDVIEAVAMTACAVPLVGALEMVIDFYLKTPGSWSKAKRLEAEAGIVRPVGRPDVDNLGKLVLDGCAVILQDDAQIVDLTCRKWYAADPRTRVRIVPL